MTIIKKVSILFFIVSLLVFSSCNESVAVEKLDIEAYLKAADGDQIYPSDAQLEMLQGLIPETKFMPSPPATDREHWNKVAQSEAGQVFLEEALSLIDKAPEVPISDAIYRRANKEGNRGIYKPRYYRTMDRLEKFVIAECIEDKGQFIPQIEVYIDSIMAMKSWLHPNHDDNENTVLEGKRVSIDLGARKFGLVLALSDALLEDKLSADLRDEIQDQLQWRITDSYLKSCKGDGKSNTWIRSTSNWNSVCTSGSVFTTIVSSDDIVERTAMIGSTLNSMVYYLSGFGNDGYCSEGTGYWNYGFGHYLYLAEIIYDYTDGKVDLFEFNDKEKLTNVANFPERYELHPGMYAPFSDGVRRVSATNDNFAYVMATKHYGAQKALAFYPDETVQTLIVWKDGQDYTDANRVVKELPSYTYFDDFGIILSRGQQEKPLSIAIKAGHNGENHNHSDVGSYVLVYDDEYNAGDIGAPSYRAGSFSKTNPARSSWGHPVPRINGELQSNGKERRGEILHTSFNTGIDSVVMDILPAYELASLEKLERTMANDRSGKGIITIRDEFKANEAVEFGTTVSTYSDIEMIDAKSFILTGVDYQKKVKVEIESQGGKVEIVTERVPVDYLRDGKDAMRIGLNFTKKLSSGSITVKYTPIEE